jgi:tape measure domain-containing protein
MQLGEVYFDIAVNNSSVDTSIDNIKNRFKTQKLTLEAVVKDGQLTALNKHLDLKKKHWDEVRTYINNNPIIARVDYNQVNNLKKELSTSIQRINLEIKSKIEHTVTINSPVQTSGLKEGLIVDAVLKGSNSTNKELQVLQRFAKQENKERKSFQKSTQKETRQNQQGGNNSLLSPITGSISGIKSLVTTPINNIVKGALERVGAEISKNLGQGISVSVEDITAPLFGSTKEIGRQLTNNLFSSVHQEIPRVEKELNNFFEKLYSSQKSKGTGKFKLSILESLKDTFDGNGFENLLKKATTNLNQADVIVESLSNTANKINHLQKRIKSASPFAHTEYVSNLTTQQRSEELKFQTESTLEKRQRKGAKLISRISSLAPQGTDIENLPRVDQLKIVRLQRQLTIVNDEKNVLLKQLGEINTKNLELSSRSEILKKIALPEQRKKREEYTQLNPEPKGLQASASIYERLARTVINDSGLEFDRKLLPAIRAKSLNKGDRLGVTEAQYDYKKNIIEVPKELYDASQTNTLTSKQISTLIHELRHAAQFNLGRDKTGEAIQALTPTPELLKKIAPLISRSVDPNKKSVKATDLSLRLETDAYTYQHQKASSIEQNVKKSYLTDKFNINYGVGGGSGKNSITGEVVLALRELQSKAKTLNVDVSSELQNFITLTDKISTIMSPLLDKAANLDVLPIDELESFYDSFGNKIRQFTQIIQQEKGSLLGKFTELESDNVKTNLSVLGKGEVLKISHRAGLLSRQTDKKSDIINTLTNPDNIQSTIQALSYRNFQAKESTKEINNRKQLAPSELKGVLKDKRLSIAQQNKQATNSQDLIGVSSELQKEYNIVLGLLSSDLDKDTLAIVQNAKLNLGKLRKKILRQTLIEYKKTKVQQTQFQSVKGDIWDDTTLYSFGDIEEELKLVKTRIQEFLKQQAIKISKNNITINKNLIGNINTSNITAQSTLNKISEAQLKQQNSVIEASAKEIEKQTNDVFKGFTEFFESRVKAYSQVLRQIDNNIGATVSPDLTIPTINHLNPPLSIPDKKTYLNINNLEPQQKPLIEKLVLPILNARKESAIKNAQSLANNIPGLSANLITSSTQHKDLGDNKQSIQLYREYKKLDLIRQQIEKSLSKPFVSFTASDTQNLEDLNEKGLKIFRTFNQDIPQDKGLLGFLNNNILKGAIDFFSNLGSVVKSALFAFISFNIGQAILPQLQQFLVTSVQVSNELENIKRILDTSSENQGLSKDVANNAKALKISIKDSLENATEFTSAVEGTSISGEIGQKVFSNFQKYFAARGGSKDQQQRANLQLEQIAALGQITYPDLKPLAQAVPGISGVLARSQGLTPGELRNRLTTDGGLGNDALVQFSQQAAIEAQSGLSVALETTNAATINLENSFLELQTIVGNLLQPPYKTALNAIADSINFVTTNATVLGIGLANIGYLLAKPFALLAWQGISVIFTGLLTKVSVLNAELLLEGRILAANSNKFAAFGTLVAQGFTALGTSLKGVLTAVAPLLLEFIGFTAVVVIVDQLFKSFQDLSGAIGKTATSNAKNLKEFRDSLKGVKDELGSGLTDDKYLRARRNASRDFNPLNTSHKEFKDTTIATQSIIDTSKQTLSTVNNSNLDEQIKQTTVLDQKLIDVQNKRKALIQTNPDDLERLKRLEKEQIKITNERYTAVTPVSRTQARIAEQIGALKSAKKALEALKDDDNIDKTTYIKQTTEINSQLVTLENKQNELTKAVGETTSAYGYMKRSLELVSSELENLKSKQELIYLSSKQNIAENLGLSQASRNVATTNIDISNLQAQKKNIEINVSQSKAILNQPSAKSVLNAYKIDNNTQEGTLKYLADKAPDSSKFVIEQQSKVIASRKEIAQLNLQIAEARLTAYNQQVDLTKSVADYYVGIANQAEISAIDTKKLLNTNRTNEGQNKLRKALEDGHDNIVTQYVDSIIESLGQKNNVADKTLDAQKALVQFKQTSYDQQKAYGDITRSIPESIYTQPKTSSYQLVDKPISSASVDKPVIIDTINTSLKKEAIEIEKSLTKIDLLKKEFSKGNYLAFITIPLDDLNKAITNEVIPKFKQIGKDFYDSVKSSSFGKVLKESFLGLGLIWGDFTKFGEQSITGLGFIFRDFKKIIDESFLGLGLIWQDFSKFGYESFLGLGIIANDFGKILNQSFTGLGFIFSDLTRIVTDWFNKLVPVDEIGKIINQSFIGLGIVLKSIAKDTYNWVNSVIPLNDILTVINQSFLGLGLIIDDISKKTQEWVGYIQQAVGGLAQGTQDLAQSASTGITSFANNLQTKISEGISSLFGKGVGQVKGTEIYDSNVGNRVKSFEDTSVHHLNSRTKYSGRTYKNIDGKNEEINNKGTGNLTLIKRDVVLKNKGSVDNVGVRAPVAGFAQPVASFGQVMIFDKAVGGNLVAKILHLSRIDVKQGQEIAYGQQVGIQGGAGASGAKSYPTHLHIEATKEVLQKYFKDLAIGNFTPVASVVRPSQNLIDTRTQEQNQPRQLVDKPQVRVSQYPEGLTPLGKKYADLAQDPRVRAFLKSVAIAEVGSTLVNAGKGYGKQIGGNYAKEEFSNPEQLTQIPASLPGRGGQNAFGRYQFHAPDLVDARKIGVKNLSPQSQDIIAVQKLVYRGALEPLLKGDLSTAIKKAGNEWASLQGSKFAGDGLNATTDGGKLPAFLRNYQTELRSPQANNIVNSALQYKPASTTDLRQTAQQARQIQLDATNSQFKTTQVQSQQDLSKEKDDYIRKQNAALRTFQRAGESLDDSYITRQRNQTDLSFQNKKNPSPRDTQNQDITGILRKYDDLLRDNKRSLRDNLEAKSDAEKALSTGIIPEGQSTNSLRERLAKYKVEIASLQTSIPQLEKLRGQAIKESENLFKRDENLRLQNTNFEIRTQDLTKKRSDLDALKTQSGLTPYADINLQIPTLEKQLSLQEADLELEKALADIEDKRYKHTFSADEAINNKLANNQIESLKKQNLSKQESIDLTFQQADANAKLEYGNKILERENTLLGIRNDMRQEELKSLGLIQKRNPLIRAGEQLNIQKSIEDETRKGELTKKQFDITNDTKLTPLQRLQDLAKIGELYRTKEKNANEQFAIDSEQQNITNLQTLATRNSSQRDFLNKPSNDLITARAGQITSRGGNQFEANALLRPNARLQENNRYATEVDSFNSQASELKFQGLITDEQITRMREALSVIHDINLENVNDQFKTFGSTIDDIAKSSIKGLSSGLGDVILKGGSLVDVFTNFADTLLSGVLQAGLDSLLSSLTGSLFSGKKSGGGLLGGGGGGILDFVGSIFSGGGGLGGILGFASGGEVPYISGGGGIRDTETALGRALKREGRNSVISTLTPGERVLNRDENRLYNALHPQGILNLKVRNFNKGGELIPSISESVVSGISSKGSTNVAVNASIESQGGKGADERQLAKSIRAVVIAELARQDRIKNS